MGEYKFIFKITKARLVENKCIQNDIGFPEKVYWLKEEEKIIIHFIKNYIEKVIREILWKEIKDYALRDNIDLPSSDKITEVHAYDTFENDVALGVKFEDDKESNFLIKHAEGKEINFIIW